MNLGDLEVSARPLPGGYSGETFLVGGPDGEAVLRIYGRNPDRAEIDAALYDLVRGLVPVPRVLDAQLRSRPDGPPFLMVERLPGERLEVVLAEAGPEVRAAAGTAVGEALARLMGIPFRAPGLFTGPDLVPRGPLPELPDLGRPSREAESLLSGVGRFCLVHSDFNPKNLLVDPDTGALTGVVDWEYAHAGSPFADIGNLLRFDPDTVFAEAVVESVTRLAPPLPANWRRIARAADLYALVELAARTRPNPIVYAARSLLSVIAGSGDLEPTRS